MFIENNRGSIWRKWDLHVHTPFTKLNDQFSKVSDKELWESYCEAIEKSDVEVFGITDYFCSDNYFTFIEEHKRLFPNSKKVFFPNIELRLEVSVNKSAEEVNIHVIFSNKIEKSKIDDFLLKLDSNISKNSAKVSCRRLSGKSDYESAGVNYEKIKEKLEEVFGRENCYIIVAAANNAGLRPDNKSPRKLNITDEIDKICDAFFGGNQNVDWYLKTDRYESDEPAKEKPVISGCDAHSFTDLENYLGKRVLRTNEKEKVEEIVKDITWIKAEPIFEGLLQILNEPSRVYIGEMPPILKRVNLNPTKYIKSLTLTKVEGSPLTDVWFDQFSLTLNPELVAIIGNKGKGKSALSDILGLCANAHIDETDFSFLNRNKFKNARPNLAKEFNATLSWEGGTPESKNLDSIPNLDSPERAKYIPQSFLEKLCTSIDKKVFEEELEKVIFSRLDDHQKLGKGTLKEVLNEKKQSLEHEISVVKNELSQKNTLLVELERRNSAQYKGLVSESLQSKENELNVHNEKIPLKKEAPEENAEIKKKTEAVTTKINLHRETIKIQLDKKEKLGKERNKLTFEINELTQLSQNATALGDYIKGVVEASQNLFQKYQLNEEEIFKYEINVNSISELLAKKRAELKSIEDVFLITNAENPDKIILYTENEIKKLQDELEGESKEYQQYLSDLQDWERHRREIIGSSEKEGTLEYFKATKEYLDTKIGEELIENYEKRRTLVRHLLKLKKSIADLYRELYGPVSEFITHNKNELSDYNVNIDVALEIVDFEGKFFNYISNGIAGSFYGSNESRIMLTKITEVVDFNEPEEVVNWLDKIIEYLQVDKREGQNSTVKKELRPQLKSGFKEKDFYDFLFHLDYYEPNYQLKLGTKNLSELSPGERGALLLIFYLLLDKRDIPIIIDQPEENLDNQSVYSILVHFIKKAKSRRQIVIVTHNPNLAVVCDAEQIIRMDIAKENGNNVSMITGGIENPKINRAIVDVLEGTRPAFNNRTDKYKVSNIK